MAYTQCTTYDGTLNTNRNVLRVTVTGADCASKARLTAWDDTNHNTTNKEILAGTTGSSNTPWLKAVDTTNGAPGTSWTNSDITLANAANPDEGPNALKGDTYYVPTAATPTTGDSITYNVICYVPSDSGAGTTGHDPVYTFRYTYTGTQPTITWYFNSGTEGSPNWTTIGGSDTIYFTGPDSTTSYIDPVVAPLTGNVKADEMWVGS